MKIIFLKPLTNPTPYVIISIVKREDAEVVATNPIALVELLKGGKVVNKKMRKNVHYFPKPS